MRGSERTQAWSLLGLALLAAVPVLGCGRSNGPGERNGSESPDGTDKPFMVPMRTERASTKTFHL
jgi:hypothetical protein